MKNYSIEIIKPFGAIIKSNEPNDSIENFTPNEIYDFVKKYRLVVFKNYTTLPKQSLALFGQKLGVPLQWVFGAINDLKVKPEIENYIFTDHEVPMHWDGAFAGKIPHIILFQCIVAPKKEDMGGTTFCDTSKIISSVDELQLKKWTAISITYATKKIVHYGGTITQKLIVNHSNQNEKTIRYAEPVEDLNPVSLSIKGLETETQQHFIETMKQHLYDANNLYTHRWEKGDIVLADNHILLHGREAFKNPNERYIQRINILHRPNTISLFRNLKNSLTIRRKEFFVAELPIFLIPIFLSITSFSNLFRFDFLIGLIAMSFLFNIGDMINCYADYELDAIYKSHLSNAVYELGKKNVLWQIAISGFIALLLTAWVSILTHQFYLIPLTIIGGFIGLQYSIKPFKFKSQGILQLFCLWGIIFFGPMLYTTIITKGFPSLILMCLFSCFGFLQMGIIMLNTAEDYIEDKASGLKTIIVALGLHRAMNFAWWLTVFAGATLQIVLVKIFLLANAPIWLISFILIVTIGWLKIIAEYKVIIKKMVGKNEDDATKELKKKGMKVPEWLKISAYCTLSVVMILFIWKSYFI
ncbi:MAG: hypothetical protein RL708_1345 [Bacteroidota bacterium]|jgi:alpha-ketoglutarate-dependent taurine dioxygenase/4-hydroxybenzoate polyprenyltransferase